MYFLYRNVNELIIIIKLNFVKSSISEIASVIAYNFVVVLATEIRGRHHRLSPFLDLLTLIKELDFKSVVDKIVGRLKAESN